ncbi:MAG: hypothetical protein H7246_18380 [Phycisphaerae bacterium]|nr:hypothetical protein [Saprospiraceae bacterium]
MKVCFLTLISCFLITHSLRAQPDWTLIVPEVFTYLDTEAADSIRNIRVRADQIRTQMSDIVQKKGLKMQDLFLFTLSAFNEGLSKQFVQEPRPLQVKMVRDADIEQLEHLHIRLFYEDVALQRWLNIEQRLKKHPDRAQFSRWALKHRNLSPQDMRAFSKPEQLKPWVKDEVMCDIVAAIDATSPDKAASKVKTFTLKFDNERLDSLDRTKEMRQWQFPVPPEVIHCSFPMNGSYSFSMDESIPGVGYLVLPPSAAEALSPMVYSQTIWRARWCSARGRVTYTPMEVRNRHEFFFNFPERYFRKGELYRLEIIATPKMNASMLLPVEICRQAYHGKEQDEQATQFHLPDEVKITEIYFRVSTTDVLQRGYQVKGKVDWLSGRVEFETEDPFDSYEMYGTGNVRPGVSFAVQTLYFSKFEAALRSSALLYYLSVPMVEPVDNQPIDKLLTAEKDNTYQAAFVTNVNEGAWKDYMNQSSGKTYPRQNLPGNYYSPSWSMAFAPDSIFTDKKVPFITRQMFEKNKVPAADKFRCSLQVGEFLQIVETLKLHKKQIERRIEERSRFLHELDRRQALRTSRPFNASLPDYKSREIENLPPDVKMIRDCQFPEIIQKKFTLSYSKYFPGTSQRLAELTIQLTD